MAGFPMRRPRRKPSKPYPSYPLTAHNNGQWCKKIRGRIHFFGVWADPQAALDQYLSVAADLHAGRQPHAPTLSEEGLTVKEICNHYLTHQLRKVESHEIGARWLEDCRRVIEAFAKSVGVQRAVSDLRPDDFEKFRLRLVKAGLEAKKGLGVHALNRAITVIKGLFKYAFDTDLIAMPVKYGPSFGKPSAAVKRRARQAADLENGKRLFHPAEILSLLKIAEVPLRSMILLGINGGMGNTDCARLPLAALDWERGVIEFDRPKTGIERVVPLWPETVAALQSALATRPKAANEEAKKLLFLTASGLPWVRERLHQTGDDAMEKVVVVDDICREFTKLLASLGMRRKGLSFYALRHTFRTWADEVRDQHAIHRIMGHAIPGMSGIYVEMIELHRLRAVVDHVRRKLFGEPAPSSSEGPAAPPAT